MEFPSVKQIPYANLEELEKWYRWLVPKTQAQVNNMVQSGAAEPDPQVIMAVTAAGALAAQAAPLVKAATPYGIATAADGILLNGLVQEVKAGMNGQCTW